jgi:alpha-tubulin suppressor-like RCC1 family protein
MLYAVFQKVLLNYPMLYAQSPMLIRGEDSKMSKIKNNSQSRKRNPIKALLLPTMVFLTSFLILFSATISWAATPKIATGTDYSLAIKSDGTLWAWGYNGYGNLGNGSTTNSRTPIEITADNNWVSIAAGAQHSLALKSDGTLWAWGFNAYGQLGDGTTTDSHIPIQIGTDHNWVCIAARWMHSLALKSDGTLWAWGFNAYGQLGDGTTTDSHIPIQIGSDHNWVSIAAGAYYSLALKSDGTLWGWGANHYGNLGDGTTNPHNSPVQIGSDTNWVSISTGYYHTLALKSDGTLWAWGKNDDGGQLGNGSTTNSNIPIRITTDTSWVSISGGGFHSLALKSDGTLYSWGANWHGQIGDNTNTDRNTPIQITTVETNWVSISAGNSHSIATKSDGSLWAWGYNGGQLGDGTTSDRHSPVQIGTDSKWVAISTGVFATKDYYHTLALKSDGTLWAWGYNYFGQLGLGDTTARLSPVQVGTDNIWVAVAAGAYHSIALKSDGTLWAWGYNYNGQLGLGDTSDRHLPTQVGVAGNWVAITAGYYHTAALKSDGTLWAWGYNYEGQLGLGHNSDLNSPNKVGADNKWVSVTSRYHHTVALKSDGTLWAWGDNSSGQLGKGTFLDDQNSPVQVGSDNKWVSVATGFLYTMGIKSDGTLWGWGANYYGELGGAACVPCSISSPIQVGADNNWIDIKTGQYHSLGLKSDGTLWVWGQNNFGQLGDGSTTNRYYPVQAPEETCSYSILPTSDFYPAGGGGGSVSVTAPDGCSWTSVSNDLWIIRISGDSGYGDGTVEYLVTINSGTTARTGSMTIAGQTFTVNQNAFDSDGDGLPDDWEIAYFVNLTQVASGDPDGDGLTNLQEYQFGTNPTVANQGIAGTVTGSGGPLQSVYIQVFDTTLNSWVASASSDSNGNYNLPLATGSYKIFFDPSSVVPSDLYLLKEMYNDRKILDINLADQITVIAGKTQIINATIERGGRISGMVLDNVTSSGVQANIGAYMKPGGNQIGSTATDSNGNFTMSVPDSIPFALWIVPLGDSYYTPEFYENKPDFGTADVVSLTVDQNFPVTIRLDQGGKITGRVTDTYLTPLEDIVVTAYDPVNPTSFYEGVTTNTDGTYTLRVPAGNWKLEFKSKTGVYLPEWYNNKLDFASADPITVAAGTTLLNINAQLSPKYTFDQTLIDRNVWADLEFVRRINNGVLESKLRRYGLNGSNYLQFFDPTAINSFQAGVKVTDYLSNGAYPHASLLSYTYNDGTPGAGATGDVVGTVGIGHNPTLNRLEGFYSISRCVAPNCNLPDEIQPICSGYLGPAALNTPYQVSFSFYGSNPSLPAFGFTYSGGASVIVDKNTTGCGSLPNIVGLPKAPTKGIGTRISQITTGSEENGFISATFDNVKVNGSDYDKFDSSDMINPNPGGWRNWEFVRMVDNGGLISALTQHGVNGSNNMSFVDSQHILGFEADLKVVEFQNNGARPQARLYAAFYNDGTGSSTPGDITGDVIASVGISGEGAVPQAFYAVSRCLAPNCNLAGEYEVLTSGTFPITVAVDETHRFSVSWDGVNVTFGCDGNVILYTPTVPNMGPPKGRKGIGTRVSEVSDASEWAYVSARFDNVVVLNTGYPLTVVKSGTGSGTVTSFPAGIDCGSDCGQGYPDGTPVTLTATPAGGSFFAGWSGGGCSGTGPCTVTMDAVKSVIADFVQQFTVSALAIGETACGNVLPSNQTVNAGGTAIFSVIKDFGPPVCSGITATVSEGTLSTACPPTGDCSCVGSLMTCPWTIPNVSSTHTVSVTFSIVTNPSPTIANVKPNYGIVGSIDNFYIISGTGFLPGATVKLTRSGQSDIFAFGYEPISPTQIRCWISLLGAEAGLWNVVVTNPDAQHDTLTDGFTVDPPGCPTPETPSNPSPSDGAANTPTNQTLGWANSANTDSFEVFFGTSSSPLSLGNVIGTSFNPPALNPNTTYYWKIKAKNNCDNSTEGPLWSFTTLITKPAPPGLASPSNGETGVSLSPTLIWGAPPGPIDSYHLQLSIDPNFATTIVDESGLAVTFYNVSGPLINGTSYYWRVRGSNNQGTGDWSDVWTFITQPPYGNLFEGVRGIADPDNDFDGLDDQIHEGPNGLLGNGSVGPDPTKRTLFIRPKQEIGLGQYQYWTGFIALFPDSRPGFANIPPFTSAGIEIMVVGDPNSPYAPMRQFNYDPATDLNHPPCDILEFIYKRPDAYCTAGSQNFGHTFFSSNGLAWSWDTKGYTPSTAGIHGYKTPQIYPFPLDNYLNEGAYSSIAVGQLPGATLCTSATCSSRSPMNVNTTDSVNGLPDGTVEFNPIAFDSAGKIISIAEPLPSTGYDKNAILRRTIAHELIHALLAGLDSDHCPDPNCLMYSSMASWELQSIGPGACVHRPGGSKDIRAYGIIHNSVHGLVATPAAPILSSPANGSATQTTAPTLAWSASAGATSYRLQVSTVQDFSTTVVNQGTITGTSYAASGLSNNATYYWRVNATNSGGTSAWSSPVRSFTTVPGAPTPTSPPNQTSPTISRPPTLRWNAPAGGAASYQVQVSTSSSNWSGTNLKFNQSGITATSQVINGLSANVTYYWRVRASNAGGGTGNWSSTWRFRTN